MAPAKKHSCHKGKVVFLANLGVLGLKISAKISGFRITNSGFMLRNQAELAQLTCEILLHAGKLSGQVSSAITRHRIALLVRTMNSYYSNLIEGTRLCLAISKEDRGRTIKPTQPKRENQLLAQSAQYRGDGRASAPEGQLPIRRE